MTCARGAVAIACWCLYTACGSDHGGSNTPSAPANALTLSIGTSNVCTNVNEPCAAVTVCQPGTATCQTISDLLVDVGSVGLRIFRSVLSVPLSQAVDSQGRALGECIFFADGGTEWGPVQMADVVLGGSPPARVPVHVIDPAFAGQSVSQNPCNSTVDADPQAARFNGIIGLGLFRQDCGPVCANHDNNNLYFSCVAGSCASTAVPLSGQVQHPVWVLPAGNNGIVMSLPNVPATGGATVFGSVLIGIGTGTNNMPAAGVSVLSTDATGVLTTVYKGKPITTSIIDSGSNGLFFPDASISSCAAPLQAFYCPPNPLNLSATIVGTNGQQVVVPFQVGNTQSLVQTGNAVFNNLGGELSAFDWGLPFFLGRTVYIGIEGQSSPLGTGPFFAF
jgi:hypothetical protein